MQKHENAPLYVYFHPVAEDVLTWTYLVTGFTEWDPCLVVVVFTSQGDVTRSTLEATIMVGPV